MSSLPPVPPASGSTDPQSSAAAAGPTFSPLYVQIKSLLMQGLETGEWKPGEMIPSEVELAQRFKVSQGTVRKAVDELASEHLLIRRQGKGTFVATHSESKVQFRFLRLHPDTGEPTHPDHFVLDCKRLRAPADIARALDLKVGETAVVIRRTLHFGGEPTILEEIWLPGPLFKGLTMDRLADYRGPMYALFEQEFSVRMIRCEERLKAVAADESTAHALAVGVGTPLLQVERLSFSYNERPVELRKGWYRTDKHHYLNALI
ncbi:MAG TPA: GntR family transcriptional regulator [Burkholderiaceae bacterium]|nr:GntR family transcriptional regulator [Burkholderiaceae bacterium]